MNCSKALKLISPYIDGELKASDREVFEFHIKSCRVCSRELEGIRNLHHLFAHAEKFKAPYSFSAKIMANIPANKSREFGGIPLFIRFAEGFALLVIIVTGIISGGFLAERLMPEKLSLITSSFSLDIFDPAPPDSLGGVYLAMTEARDEK